jgi:peroxiredoxin
MTIAVGEKLPEATLKRVTPDGPKDVTTEEFFGGRKIVMFGVPGAFTPTCSNSHLPGFIENRDAILARGVDAIAVIANNDHHVMTAWARFTGAEDKIDFLADGNSTFIEAMGLAYDMSAGGLGRRTLRFSMIVEDGVVKTLNMGDKPGQAEITGAARILEQLGG